MASIILTCTNFSGSSTRRIYAQSITPSLRKNIEVKAIENGSALAKVQTQSYENPRYVIRTPFISAADSITYADVLTLLRLKYGDIAAPTITVTYGTASTLVGADGSTTAIKVILESCDFPIDVSDSRDGYMPMATLTFVETR